MLKFPASRIVDYADATLIVAKGAIVNEVQECANEMLEIVSEHIDGVGLCVAMDNTQVVAFVKCQDRRPGLSY